MIHLMDLHVIFEQPSQNDVIYTVWYSYGLAKGKRYILNVSLFDCPLFKLTT